MDFYNADETPDQEYEDKFAAGFEPFRENLVFLIDAQPAMFEETELADAAEFKGDSWFDAALKTTREILKARIISSDNDRLAVVFYGTRESQNNNAFDSIYTFQDLDMPDAQRIRGLESLLGGKFEQQIGSKGSADPEQLHYALWTASQLLSSASSKASKRILIFTRDESPAGQAGNFKEQILSRAQELSETNTQMDLLPMIPADQKFDMSFWSAVLQKAGEEDSWEYEGQYIPDRLTSLAGTVRHKAYRKRVLSRDVHWSLGNGFEIAVSLYAMVHTAVKGAYTYVKAQNNEPLRSETAFICNDTGAVLTKTNLTKSLFPNPTQYKTARYPKILLTTDEMQEIRNVQPKGLRLLGFKSVSMLKHHHQLRSPTFLYPDEQSMPGGTQTFIALHAAMLKKNKMAVCSFVRTKAAEPRLVALLPQQEELEDGIQVTPPGMNMVYLPYSDDLRQPEADLSFTGASHPKADEHQVQAAERLMNSLNLQHFASSGIPNPTLQRHYQVLECYALNEEPPEKVVDETQPDVAGMNKHLDAIVAFRDAVYGEGQDDVIKPKMPASRKRKSAEEEQSVKEEADAINFKGLAADGKLGKLTVNDLKKYCEVNQLPKSGKKDDIVQRITAHLNTIHE